MKTIQIQPTSVQEMEFLTALLNRLSVAFEVQEKEVSDSEIEDLYGSWEMEETADEIIDFIYQSRTTSNREIEL